MVELLIRLRFTLGRHSFGGARWFTLSVIALGAALTWYLAVTAASDQVRSGLLMLVLAVWAGAWVLGPTITNGVGVLRSQYFTLLPLDRNRVGAGLLVTMFVGPGALLTLVVAASVAWHAWASDPATLFLGLLGMLMLVVFMVSLSRLVFRALGAAMHSRIGMEIASVQWGLILAGLMFGWAAVQPALAAMGSLPQVGVQGTAATVLSLIPTSWPLLAVDAATMGAWGAAFGWLGAFGALTLATVLVTVRLLAPSVTSRGVRRRSRPLGSRVFDGGRSFLPDTPLGAVVGKELRQWWRDPWRGLELRSSLYAGLFIGLLGLISYLPQVAPFSGVVAVLIMGMASSNLYGHDGTALWLTVVGQGRDTHRVEIRGRQIAIAVLIVPLTALMSAVMVVATGEYWAVPFVLTGLVLFVGVTNGLAVLLSVVAVTPGVDPHQRVDANDSGDNQLQVWFSMAAFPVLSAPAIAATVWLGLQGMPWLALPIALANGALVSWLLGRVAYRRLERRLPEMFTRIRYGKDIAAQAVPESGGSLLDQLERGALASNAETKPTGS
ncbi:hypothetical protein [Nocardiopsis metallicus]|uniref:ABC-2 type transport system permease protein n=1 Tax=Nocardiopsis metallicus TaxID=179819 RepID=A0A840W974_9ACTN|nr:hypothetical protein [Nocardiopsis metallicus]MBB5491923.1 ABC-2 type transport system permease protein [Nocardiopsis metallicus]